MTAVRRPGRRAAAAARSAARAAGRSLFLAPTLIGLAILSAGPILATLAISLTKWDLLTAPKFVGLDNYVGSAVRRPVPEGAPEHVLLHDRVGAARAG